MSSTEWINEIMLASRTRALHIHIFIPLTFMIMSVHCSFGVKNSVHHRPSWWAIVFCSHWIIGRSAKREVARWQGQHKHKHKTAATATTTTIQMAVKCFCTMPHRRTSPYSRVSMSHEAYLIYEQSMRTCVQTHHSHQRPISTIWLVGLGTEANIDASHGPRHTEWQRGHGTVFRIFQIVFGFEMTNIFARNYCCLLLPLVLWCDGRCSFWWNRWCVAWSSPFVAGTPYLDG